MRRRTKQGGGSIQAGEVAPAVWPYRLDMIGGHLVAGLAEGRQLIDTGAPASIVPSPELQRLIGAPVDLILGLDQLNGRILRFDLGRRLLSFLDHAVPGEAVSLRRGAGIPLVPVKHEGQDSWAILDTGAQLSYAPAEIVAGGRDHERRADFNPALGEYEVQTALIPVEVGGRHFELRVAAPPAPLRVLLAGYGLPEWILGSQLFEHGTIVLDLREDRLIFPAEREGRDSER